MKRLTINSFKIGPKIWAMNYLIYHYLWPNIENTITESIKAYKKLDSPMVVVDIGCGNKPYVNMFRNCWYIGIDYSALDATPDAIGSAMVIARTLLKMGQADRKIFLYDTFQGMTEATEKDYQINDGSPAVNSPAMKQRNWCFASIEDVRKNLFSTAYLKENIIFVKGKIENTIPSTIPSVIALLRLDTDWYESTFHELVYLFPLLETYGVLIIDDYGFWAGARNAVNEYISKNNIHILLNGIDRESIIGIKTAI